MGWFVGIAQVRLAGNLCIGRHAFASFTDALGWIPLNAGDLDPRENPAHQKVLRGFKAVETKWGGRMLRLYRVVTRFGKMVGSV
jgi:hypothetical protein